MGYEEYITEILDTWDITVLCKKNGFKATCKWDEGDKTLSIVINNDQDLKEKVISFFHELLHTHPELDPIQGCLTYYIATKQGREIEQNIENEARNLYQESPNLVKKVISTYGLSQ